MDVPDETNESPSKRNIITEENVHNLIRHTGSSCLSPLLRFRFDLITTDSVISTTYGIGSILGGIAFLVGTAYSQLTGMIMLKDRNKITISCSNIVTTTTFSDP
jgi:hypothetical protein